MTIIDQRILIPASPEVVWEVISDINNNPRWQADCQSISFLSSLRSGPGMRWRYTSPNGQEFVVETTAWYDRLGYEYIFIDGAPFRSSKGTIRLQEIAEGTVVQWTLNYEIGGILGGMRNALSVRRHFDGIMVDSLKGLWTYLKESGKARQSHEAKSLMRDALDYEARAQYTPRHPSRIAERESLTQAEDPVSVIEEPPVSDDDTRPNPTLVTEPAPAAPVAEAQPEAPKPEEPKPEASKPDIRGTDEWQIVSAEPELARFQRPAVPEPPMPLDTPSKPIEPIAVEPVKDVPLTAEPEAEATQSTVSTPQAEASSSPAVDDFGPKIDTSKMDTREISIWEVFGVLSPSDTERMKAITDKDLANEAQAEGAETPVDLAPQAAPAVVEAQSAHVSGEATRPITISSSTDGTASAIIPGFRVLARRKRIKVRRRIPS